MSELDSSLYEVNDTHVLRFEDEKSGRMASRRTVTNSDGTLYVNTPFTFTLDNDHGDLTLDEGNHIIPCEFTYNADAQILTLYKFMVDGHPLVFKPREN